MSKKSPLKATKLVKHRRRIFWLKVGIVLLALAGLVYATSVVSKIQALNISTITIVGNSAVDKTDLEHIVQAALTGSYAHLYPKSNKLFYPNETIEAAVYGAFKRIEKVKLDTVGTTLNVVVTERTPSFVWCKGEPSIEKKDCYFIDSQGYIFSAAPEFSGDAFFGFYGLIEKEDPIGMQYTHPELFLKLDQFVTSLQAQPLDIYALKAEADGTYTIYIARGGKIIFKQDQDIALLMSNMKTIVQSTTIFKNKDTGLEYIDLRYGNKIYYKLTGDNAIQREP